MSALQTRLLDRAATLLKPGGTLVYCTCSLEPEEGEAQSRRCSAAIPACAPPDPADEVGGLAELLTPDGEIRTLPCHLPDPEPRMGGLDGFYAARIIRV